MIGGITLGLRPRALERSFLVDQPKNFFSPPLFEPAFLHNRFDQPPMLIVTLFHQVDQRKGQLPLSNVIGDGLPKLRLGGYEIQDVVDQLKSNADQQSVAGKSPPLFACCASYDSAGLRAHAEHVSRLASDYLEVLAFRDGAVF